MAKTGFTKPGPLKQDTLIIQLYLLYKINILQLSDDFDQIITRKNKHHSSSKKEKLSLGSLLGIVPLDHSVINTCSIGESWALERSIYDNSDLMLISNLPTDLGSY